MTNRVLRAGLAVAIVTLAACGDSTSPNWVSPAQLAMHIDSLAAASAATPNGTWRQTYLGEIEALPANGARPLSILVGTHAGSQRWQGFILRSVGNTFGPEYPDSVYTVFAYSDFSFTNLLVAQKEFWPDGQGTNTNPILVADTVLVFGGSGTMAVTLGPTGAACATMSGLKYNGSYAGPAGGCVLETFTGAFTWTFQPTAHVDPNLLSLVIPTQTLDGVFLNLN